MIFSGDNVKTGHAQEAPGTVVSGSGNQVPLFQRPLGQEFMTVHLRKTALVAWQCVLHILF